ncbi:carbohydrate ABC transporter permease [Rathayibacter sp. Leaf248]|uniref:carbohydrate ABC transporter permease n=1 Tax=Rathayibacter sp. Leaf248 TaxID=2876555 RepID=UPI001E4E5183|nr:sugar ABC transporter permease [Rathayibacter sp. Leaf248]
MTESSTVLPVTPQTTHAGGSVETAAAVPGLRSRRRPPRRAGHQKGLRRFLVACLAPAFLLYILFMIVPTIDVFRMSLFRTSSLSNTSTFIGFENFVLLASDPAFLRAFQNTVLMLVVVTIVTMGSALVLAAVMTRQNLPGRNVYRFVLYVPSVLSIVVIAAIFSAVYDQSNGLLNSALGLLGGGQGPVWLGDQSLVMFSIAIAMVWQSVGYYLVLYMASMSAVPEDLYEASSLDGASPVRQFLEVTLPMIWPSIRTSLTFFIISSVNLSFVLVRAMTGGGPDGASEVLLSYMYQQAYTNSSYGYGMAIGVVIFVFSFTLALIVNRVTKREDVEF